MKYKKNYINKQLITNYNNIKLKKYVGYSFILFLFTEKLYNVCKQKKIKKLFFLSREGEFMKKLFETYLELNNDYSIQTFYLYTSRISSFVASLESIEDENFNTLFNSYPDMSIEKFLVNCGFDKNQIEKIQQQTDQDITAVICNIRESEEFYRIKEMPVFIELYDEIRLEQKRCFEEYLRSFHVDFAREELNVVDVGWKGTIQDNLIHYFRGKVVVNGYYMGLNGEHGIQFVNQKTGLLFSNVNGFSPYFDVYFYDYTFLERLLFASHGSVVKYSCLDNRYIPITRFYGHELANWKAILPIQEEILENFRHLFSIFSSNLSFAGSNEKTIAYIHYKTVIHFSDQERQLQNMMLQNHIENFGIWNFTKKIKFMPDASTFLHKIIHFDKKNRSFLFTMYLNMLLVFRQHKMIYKILKLPNQLLIRLYLQKQKG